MADIVDKATDWIEREFELRWANRQRTITLPRTGKCYNCEALVSQEQIFCDDECAEEYEWVKQRLKDRS